MTERANMGQLARRRCVLGVLVVLATGCGVEYTANRRGVRSSVQAGYRTTPPPDGLGAGYDATLNTHTITLLDRTGILLAIFGTTANALEARRDAIRNARLTGKSGKVYYSYETTPVVPGFDMRLYYSFGGGTGFDMDRLAAREMFGDSGVSFREMGMRLDFVSKPLDEAKRWYWGVAWDTRLVTYKFESTPRAPLNNLNRDVELELIYLPAELSLSHLLTPRVRVTASVEYDPIMGIIDVAGLDVHQQYGAGARADFMITPWLIANASVELQRSNDGSSEFSRRVDQWVAGLGLSFQLRPRGR